MTELNIINADVNRRVCVAARDRVNEQGVASNGVCRVVGVLVDSHLASVTSAATTASNRLGDDRRGCVGSHVDHLRSGVLVLAGASKSYRKGLPLGVLSHQEHRGVLHRDLGAEVAINPLHRCALVRNGALGHQVVDVGRPVLDGRVPNARILLDDDFHDGGVKGVGRVDRRCTALDVVHVATLISND